MNQNKMKQKLSDYGINGDDNSKEYSNPKTAIEWLENEFQEMCKDFGGLHTDFIERFQQAKAMDEKNLKDSFVAGAGVGEMFNNENRCYVSDAEQYLKETFKSE